jgi:hypothetical protein
MQLSLLGFALGKREGCSSQLEPVLGKGKVTSFSSLAFILLLIEMGEFRC